MGLSEDRAVMRSRIGTWGAWVGALTAVPAAIGRPTAAAVEAAGYSCLWYPEGMGVRESFSNGAVLLGATERILVASGIAKLFSIESIRLPRKRLPLPKTWCALIRAIQACRALSAAT